MLEERSVLVTGGAGFIGSNTVTRLSDENDVTVLDDLSTGRRQNLDDCDAEFVQASILEGKALSEAMADADVVFHQAAVPSVSRSVEDPATSHRVNVDGTFRVLEAARREDPEALVFASSSSVYGDTPELPKTEEMRRNPRSPYASAKALGEHYVRSYAEVYGLNAVSLRYFNVYGPRQDPAGEYAAVIPKFVTRALEGKDLVIYGDGEQTRDFTYVGDVVNANVSAAQEGKPGEVYNVASGHDITINELTSEILQITGSPSKTRHDSPRPGDIRHSLGVYEKLKKDTGWRPATGLLEGLEKTVRWFE